MEFFLLNNKQHSQVLNSELNKDEEDDLQFYLLLEVNKNLLIFLAYVY